MLEMLTCSEKVHKKSTKSASPISSYDSTVPTRTCRWPLGSGVVVIWDTLSVRPQLSGHDHGQTL